MHVYAKPSGLSCYSLKGDHRIQTPHYNQEVVGHITHHSPTTHPRAPTPLPGPLIMAYGFDKGQTRWKNASQLNFSLLQIFHSNPGHGTSWVPWYNEPSIAYTYGISPETGLVQCIQGSGNWSVIAYHSQCVSLTLTTNLPGDIIYAYIPIRECQSNTVKCVMIIWVIAKQGD